MKRDGELPVIASVTKDEQIALAAASKVKRVNLLAANIVHLDSVVRRLKEAGKQVFVHVDMISGLGRDLSAVQYLAQTFRIDGILSTKSQMITFGKQFNLKTIQRVFAIDSSALETAGKMIAAGSPDEVELMPALMPRVIREMKAKWSKPLIVGGLIRTQEEIDTALEAGADYVSVGDPKFWQ
jgi:glycerol uptake operon antiterminator